MRPDTPQILRRPPGPPLFLPRNGHAADTDDKNALTPSPKLSADPREAPQNGAGRYVRMHRKSPSASRPTAFPPPKTTMRETRTTKTHAPPPNCPPIRRKRPKTDRTGTSGCTASPRRPPGPPLFLPENGHAADVNNKKHTLPLAQTVRRSEGNAPKRSGPVRPDAPQMPPPGLPPRRFFLPRRREPDTMRTEERERQAKGKGGKDTRDRTERGKREGRRRRKRGKPTAPKTDSALPQRFAAGPNLIEDRRSGQPEPVPLPGA